ncbi:MAG: gamma carbonic anhydrase family protein [Pseudomonadota bacterium]
MGHVGNDVALDDPAFVHDTALLYGRVSIGRGSSVFPYVVMRAETHEIRIGERTNIQDHVMIHVGDFTPTIVGDDCSITHRATLHGCEIGDRCLVGINATIMDGAKLGDNCVVAGHAIVNNNQTFGDNAVIAGVPAKKIAERDNSGRNLLNAKAYELIARNYAAGVERLSDEQIAALLSEAT